MSQLKLPNIFIGLIIIYISACSSTNHVGDEYRELLARETRKELQKIERSGSSGRSGMDFEGQGRTVLVFLVDGLPLGTLRSKLQKHEIPEIESFFGAANGSMAVARAGFPSLTYPGVGSLLTRKPIDLIGLYGNKIVLDDDEMDFENPSSHTVLNAIIKDRNIFSALRDKGQKSVSFDFGFQSDASVPIEFKDLDVGLAFINKKYQLVDKKLIKSLENLLSDNSPRIWPNFIFIHLIGLDLISHESGAQSEAASNYFSYLDRQLKRVFKILKSVEESKQRQIVTLLTSDHGFDKDITQIWNYQSEQIFESISRRSRIVNESRFLTIYPKKNTLADSSNYSADIFDLIPKLWKDPKVELTAYRNANRVYVHTPTKSWTMEYSPFYCKDSHFALSIESLDSNSVQTANSPFRCPEEIDNDQPDANYPYLLTNLAHYFQGEGHPEALIVPVSGVSFKATLKGQHGGPNPEEVFVPLLLRNATLANPHGISPLWKLLQFM